MPLMPPRVRKIVLAFHVIISVGWLGVDFAMLTLGITGFTASDLETMRESYVTMERFGEILVIPAGLGAVLTGLTLALCTPWGLIRYRWVLTKLIVALAAVALAVFALPIQLHHAASLVTAAHPTTRIGFVRNTLVIAPSLALCLYSANVVISIFKPWGKTSYGKHTTADVRRSGG
jgi:uncharacterized membrane protein